MEWTTLFTTERIDHTPSSYTHSPSRHSYQKDFDRIIFSTGFRRLQDKTQVFPLPGPTFVHNRLTHSLEVASVGRSLAEGIGQKLCQIYNFDANTQQFYLHQFPWVISSACLAHDIGNPPFGHSGEDAIRHFFRQCPEEIRHWLTDHLSEWELRDLTFFEGNSMAFRYLTQQKSSFHSDLNLTLSTIASIIKYPCSSMHGFKKNAHYSLKKSNYFSTESIAFERIMKHFNIPLIDSEHHLFARHPFVYLTEAADDICYTIIDLEDAHRLRIISTEQYIQMLLPFFESNNDIFSKESVLQKLKNIQQPEQQVSFIRAIWIGLMVNLTTTVFLENEKNIIDGSHSLPLLSCLPMDIQEKLKLIQSFSVKNVYKYPDSVAIEISGYEILCTVLSELMNIILHPDSSKSKLIIAFLQWDENAFAEENKPIERVMYILDFVTASTDSYIMDLYKKLKAII